MTTFVASRDSTVLRRAAVRATLAPSVHNSQPWRLHLRAGGLEVHADRSRQLAVLDPTGRQLTISCGCAVLNARVSLAADGLGVQVRRRPDPAVPGLLATLVPSSAPPDFSLSALSGALDARQTNRRAFFDDPAPPDLLATLVNAAAREDAALLVLRDLEQQTVATRLSHYAESVAELDPAYRAELRAWTTGDAQRRDGVLGIAAATDAAPSEQSCLALLCTDADDVDSWVRAGEALERVLLEITRFGFAASPLCLVAQVPLARARLRTELGLSEQPHLLLRIGRAPATPAARRRRLVDLLVEDV